MKSEIEANRAVEVYADTVRRVCFMYLKNYNDAEDVFQEVFLKYLLRSRPFESDAHEKAWFIRVAINCCKDTLKSAFRRKYVSLEDISGFQYTQQESREKDVLEAVLKLPQKYRNTVYLFYYEGYSAVEIAKILRKKENTIYTWLSRARCLMKEILGGDEDGF